MALCKSQKEDLKKALAFAIADGCNKEECISLFNEVQNELHEKEQNEKREVYEVLFKKQLQKLIDAGYAQNIIDMLQEQMNTVLDTAVSMNVSDNHIPFIPVVPRSYWGLNALMNTIEYKGIKGYSVLPPHEVTDEIQTPEKPYYIYDVEDGKEYLGISPKDSEKKIAKDSRSPLTVQEGIALALHVPVLQGHFLDCTGSRYRGNVPGVGLFGGGVPGLGWGNLGGSSGRWGSPSCRSRH